MSMENKILKFLINQFRDGFFHVRLLNSKDIAEPIVNAINRKEYETVNPDLISEPIVEELKQVTKAIEDKEIVREVTLKNANDIKTDFSEVVKLLKAIFDKKEKDVVIPKTDLTPILKALAKIEKQIPQLKAQEVTDYTLMLDEMCKIMEGKHYSQELTDILSAIQSFQQTLLNFEFPQLPLNEKGEVKVEKARIFFDGKVQNESGAYINPTTEETQLAIDAKLESIDQEASTIKTILQDGLIDNPIIATEATLQAVLAASGGSVYNYIQKETGATYTYYGFASTTGWQIKRKTLATGVWQVAEGTGDYDTAWADRANKDYQYTT